MKMRGAAPGPLAWVVAGLAAFALLPWHAVSGSLLQLRLPAALLADPEAATGLWQALLLGKPALLLSVLPLVLGGLPLRLPQRARGRWMVACGLGGTAWILLQANAEPAFPRLGLGLGASAMVACLLGVASIGLAHGRTRFSGEPFMSAVAVFAGAVLLLFVAYPLVRGLASAFIGEGGLPDARAAYGRLGTARIWSLACLHGQAHCGLAWNTMFLALLTACGTTLLGTLLALAEVRSGWAHARAIRAVVPLPFVAPPFVTALLLVLLFGRSGVVTQALESAFGIPASRGVYGLPGLWLAQMLAFTPVAYLILRTALVGLNPALEESARTMGASPGFTFRRITLPLLARALMQAFLVGFLESIADFGTPIVVGGSYGVLSTEIFFAIVGAQFDPGQAAALAALLAALALAVFALERRVLRHRAGWGAELAPAAVAPAALPRPLRRLALAVGLPWVALTLALYAAALASAFVEAWGRDFHPTLRHFELLFGIRREAGGWVFSGLGWSSLFTTLRLAAVAAVATACGGVAIAWLVETLPFRGRRAIELAALTALAVPGAVLGLCYILVFNRPPVELTGTQTLIVLCFVFRNLPVCEGMATTALRQIGSQLHDASRACGAPASATLLRVYFPLLRPVFAATLVYSFVRSMTTLSAVVFLVTAETELASTFIISRVGQGDYGVAFAYSAVLVLLLSLFTAAANWWAAGVRAGSQVRPSRYLRTAP
jgi:iron(III) transport system permease protein